MFFSYFSFSSSLSIRSCVIFCHIDHIISAILSSRNRKPGAEKISKFYNEEFEGKFTSKNVLVTVGSTEGLSSVLKTTLAKGDEVIIPTPSYVGYEPLIRFLEAKTIFLDLVASRAKEND